MKKTTIILGILLLTIASIGLTSFSTLGKKQNEEISAPVSVPENVQGAKTESNKAAWN